MTFGNPNLFVMGTVEQTLYAPETGNIVGYDRLANDVAVNYTFDFTDITGFANSLVFSIPQNTRLKGTYTSAAFSLAHRAMLTGSEINYNATSRVCETVTANSETLTVSRTPAKFYAQPASDKTGWCYVHEQGAASYDGTCYHVDLVSKSITDFTASIGKTYEVTYFTALASSQSVGLRSAAQPNVVTVVQKWAVYAAQNGSRANGTLQGYLYFIVPRALLEGDAGMDGNQTTNSKTNYNWRAIDPTENLPQCDACGNIGDYLAYYVFVPCGEETQSVVALAVVGGNIELTNGESRAIPVKYVMPDDSLVQPNYSDLLLDSTNPSVATVSNGVVTNAGVEEGSTVIEITLVSNPDIKTSVTVTAKAV